MDSTVIAVTMLTAAAGASGQAPADPKLRSQWMASVEDLALTLYRRSQDLADQIEMLADVQPVRGVITSVKDASGRGLITIRPTMGNDQDKPEDFRTPWLSEPRGQALFEEAKALVGVEVRIGKWYEEGAQGRKYRMAAWIEPLRGGGGEHTPEPARAPAPQAAPAPAPTPATNGHASKPEPGVKLADLAQPDSLAQLIANVESALGLSALDATQHVAKVGTTALSQPTPMQEWRQPHIAKVWRALVSHEPF